MQNRGKELFVQTLQEELTITNKNPNKCKKKERSSNRHGVNG
jgi:hypothetical protein